MASVCGRVLDRPVIRDRARRAWRSLQVTHTLAFVLDGRLYPANTPSTRRNVGRDGHQAPAHWCRRCSRPCARTDSRKKDCASAWREAFRAVDAKSGHAAYDVIIDVMDPVANTTRQDARIAVVDDFLSGCDKSLETVANTIFPAGL